MQEKSDSKTWREALALNRRALALLWRHCPQLVLSRLLYALWTALTPYVGIWLAALVVDELAGGRDVSRLRLLVILTLAAEAAIALGTALLNRWKEIQNAGAHYELEHIFSRKLLDTDFANLDETANLELLSTVRQNQNSGGWGLQQVLRNAQELCAALLTILGGVSLTVSLFLSRVPDSAGAYTVLNEPWLAALVIAVMLAVTLLAPALDNRASRYWAEQLGGHNFANRFFHFYSQLSRRTEVAADVRIYRQERFFRGFFQDKGGMFGSDGIFAHLARGPIGLYRGASAAVSVVFTGVAYVFVCLKAWAGAFGLGAVTQYISSITKVSGGVSGLIATCGDMRSNAVCLEQVFRFLDIPDRMYQGSLTVEKRRDRNYQVEFRDVSFRYPGQERYALRHVNMRFTVGKRLAVVGMNGSGKTTFIKLLCRLYDPTEGEILLNGIDIRKYSYREYMDIFSVVFQDFQLFALPLGENVAAGSSVDGGRAADCLEKAGFSQRLTSLPQGLESCLYQDYRQDGINISGGEAQKIAIARSLYKDAPFIILDEPTAALDPIAEAEIYTKFNAIAGDKTAIYISHRLSSCRFCDEIAVFHNGEVVQQGTHDELVADETGKYYELWHAQAQYYVE